MSRGTWLAFVLSSTLLATAPLWRSGREAPPVSDAVPGLAHHLRGACRCESCR